MKYSLLTVPILACCNLFAQDPIFYSSLNHAVQLGQFDGVVTVKELKQNGNVGVGSSHRIASELVMINDTAYSLAADGSSMIMSGDTRLAFAATKKFAAEKAFQLNTAMNLSQLEFLLDSLAGTNQFSAIRISGRFDSITYKCYLPQDKPYKPIKEAAYKLFTRTDLQGDIIGFFTPKSALILSNPSYHFHFIDQARKGGGHVMSARINNIRIEVDYADRLIVALPSPQQLVPFDLNKKLETE